MIPSFREIKGEILVSGAFINSFYFFSRFIQEMFPELYQIGSIKKLLKLTLLDFSGIFL